MQKHQTASSYRFQRATSSGLILVLNEGSYVMAEYSEQTGAVKWQRVMLATQKEAVERQLRERYPVQAPAEPDKSPRTTSTRSHKASSLDSGRKVAAQKSRPAAAGRVAR